MLLSLISDNPSVYGLLNRRMIPQFVLLLQYLNDSIFYQVTEGCELQSGPFLTLKEWARESRIGMHHLPVGHVYDVESAWNQNLTEGIEELWFMPPAALNEKGVYRVQFQKEMRSRIIFF